MTAQPTFPDAPRAAATDTPTVSVIICAYTEERWDDIVAAVASVRGQTLRAHELLLVIDHDAGLLERARELDARVIANTAPERGLAGARNTGIAASTGDIIAFLDDDARAAPDWLESLVAPYADPDVLGVGGHIEVVWATREPRWFPDEFNWVVGCTYRGMPTTRDGAVRNMIGANMSLRRRVFDEVGGFSAQLGRVGKTPVGGEETELCIRAKQRWPAGRFMHVPAARVWHRQPASRATWRYFSTRCYAEGRSKAILSGLVGRDDGLASERTYATRVLPAGVLRGVRDALRGDAAGLGRSAAIVGGLALTGFGFVAGSVGSRRRSRSRAG